MGCNVCWAWCPKQYEVWRYVDQEAYCKVLKKVTNREEGESCPYYSLIKPADYMDRDVAEAQQEAYTEYKHQEEAFERYKDSSAIPLFLDPGLGKSAIAIHLACYRYKKNDINALLIIAPNEVHFQWYKEQLPLWMRHYNTKYHAQIIGGKKGKKSYPFRNPDVLQVVVTNVDTFSTPKRWEDIALWANNNRTMIVLDEATDIKNITANRTQRILTVFNKIRKKGKAIIESKPKSIARIVLTGTPITNGPFDLWTIMEFVHPGFFGMNYYAFKKHYGLFYTMMIKVPGSTNNNYRTFQTPVTRDIWTQIKNCPTFTEAFANFGVSENVYKYIKSQDQYQGPYRRVEELKEKVSQIAMFKKLDDCVDMPAQIFNKRLVDMNPEQAKAYYSMEQAMIAEYEGVETTAMTKLAVLTRLQQIVSGFICGYDIDATNDDVDIPPSKEVKWLGDTNNKLELMYKDVEVAVTNGPVIIITRFSCEAARIFDDLQAKKYKCCLFTGWKIEGTLQGFQEGKFDCLVANIRKIRRGFNLQNSHQTFFYSNTFSLEDRIQAEGRTYRIGQKNKTIYTDYIMKDTIDMKIVAALRQKRSLLDYMMDSSIKDFLTAWDEVAQIEYNDLI